MKVLKAANVWDELHRGNSARMEDHQHGSFSVGDRVIARRTNHPGHIRLPEYVQGRMGTIAADYGTFIFPDRHAEGIKEPQRLYSVRFEASELWELDAAQSHGATYVDLFESYLNPVQ